MRTRCFLLMFALSVGAAQAASPWARDVEVTTVQTVVLRVRQRTESDDEKKTSTERSASRKENSDTTKTTKTPSATRKSSTLSSRTSTLRGQLTATGTPHSSIDPSTSGPFPIETSSSPEPTSEPPPSPQKKKSKGPMLAGILISLIGVIAILVSALLYLRRRKRRVTAFHSGKTLVPGQGIAYDELRTTSGNHVVHERWYSPFMTRTKKLLGREDARLRDVKSAEEYRYSELPELVAVERINVRSP